MKACVALLVGGLLAGAVAASPADGTQLKLPVAVPKPPSRTAPRTFAARYRLSAYGVYHRTLAYAYHAAPCQVGGKGGGFDALVRWDETLHWDTVHPALAVITRFPGQEPSMQLGLLPGAQTTGIVANVTMTVNATSTEDSVTCMIDGTERRDLVANAVFCNTHTYKSGYLALPTWPHLPGRSGERFAFSLRRRPRIEARVQHDWSDCGGAEFEPQDHDFLNGPLPFSDLPRKVHGKLTAIGRGRQTVVDEVTQQNHIVGATVHHYEAHSATDYITFVRLGQLL